MIHLGMSFRDSIALITAFAVLLSTAAFPVMGASLANSHSSHAVTGIGAGSCCGPTTEPLSAAAAFSVLDSGCCDLVRDFGPCCGAVGRCHGERCPDDDVPHGCCPDGCRCLHCPGCHVVLLAVPGGAHSITLAHCVLRAVECGGHTLSEGAVFSIFHPPRC